MNKTGSSNRWDAIVIGAGLGGMSTAAYLAAAGQRVLLLERYSVLGGSSHVFRRKRQWEFDVGVHYIGDCGPEGQVPTLLRGLGLADRIEWLPLETDGFDTIIGPDLELKVPLGWDNYLENLLATFPGQERGLRRYVSTIRQIGENINHSTTPAAGRRELARTALTWGKAAPWALAPHAALLAACGLRPQTILALSVHAGAQCTTPQVQPVALHAAFLHGFVGGGGWFPRGGGQVLAAGFAEVIRGHGGHIRTRVDVERILVEHGRVAGVRLHGGEELRSPVVVSAIDIKRTYRDLVDYEHLPRLAGLRTDRWKMAPPLINGYFGIEIDLTDTPNTNYYVIPHWEDAKSLLGLHRMSSRLIRPGAKVDARSWAHDFAANQVAYVQSSTRRDPSNTRSAPTGSAAIEAQTMAPSNPVTWGISHEAIVSGAYRTNARYREVKEIVLDGLLQRVDQAFPGAATKVRWSELATPATQERYTNTTGGNSYGLEPRISQFGPLRPRSRTAIPGLFLAGTSTAWGPGTEGSMLSGIHAAGAILGRDLAAEVRDGAVIADPGRLQPWADGFDPLESCRPGRDADESEEDSAPVAVQR